MSKERLEAIKNSINQVDEVFLANARTDMSFLIELVAQLEEELNDAKREIYYLEDALRYET